MQLLPPKHQTLLTHERQLLSDLRVALLKFGATETDQKTLSDSIRQLDEFFLLVIVGEFNAGKSAFINALLGQKLLKEGVTPTTTQINLLRYGETEGRIIESEHVHILTAPSDLLRNLSIVDTPGTNAIIREHEEITTEFVPRADMVLFITSADRPFSESERTFLQSIRDWGKKIVIVVNKIDILESKADLEKVLAFVTDNAGELLGTQPEIFPVSARLAFRAKHGEPQLWPQSRFEELEFYMRDTLDEGSRLRHKLLNPVGVGEYLVDRYLTIMRDRLGLLSADFTMLSDVESQLAMYKADMQRDFAFRMSDVEKILFEMETRGDEFFEETIRLARVPDLLKKDRVQHEFEQKVVGEVPHQIDSRVGEMIDWLVEADLRQWQAVTDHLSERRQKHKDRIVGEAGIGTFHSDRERLIDGVGREAKRVVEGYDKTVESRKLAEGIQQAIAQTALAEVGAIGLGALITYLATTLAVDVTGILIASVIAVLGFIILPAQRRRAKKDLHEKIAEMREKLTRALRTQFEKEINGSVTHIQDAIAPYTRFVRSERSKLVEAEKELDVYRIELGKVRGQVEGLGA
ncbi:MAG: dynamin family protein [Anaerolineales bacterium]|nr:dynamin family protein [Anaerolineales bacterium]